VHWKTRLVADRKLIGGARSSLCWMPSLLRVRVIDTGGMPDTDSLKRLGGGRWETRDGRFAIEPQSGTWVIVDNEQTDELGLPLVRGPFGSLTAAKEAIESARTEGPKASPLADRMDKARLSDRSIGAKQASAKGVDGNEPRRES